MYRIDIAVWEADHRNEHNNAALIYLEMFTDAAKKKKKKQDQHCQADFDSLDVPILLTHVCSR